MTRPELPPLHLVTDDAVCARPDLRDAARAALEAGGAELVLHLRAPRAGGRALFERACWLAGVAAGTGGRLVVNDRVDVALAAGAHGVQLGERSLALEDVRPLLPAGFLAGVSVHAADAPLPAADWVMAGNVFATRSHPGRPGAGVGLIRALAARRAPVVAIGGVTPERVAEVRAAGARGIAVLGGVWDAPDPGAAVKRYMEAWYA